MKNPLIKSITSQIDTIDADLKKLHGLINERRGARQAIEGPIAAAQASVDAASRVLIETMTNEAAGESSSADVQAARAALDACEKDLAATRKRQGEADDLAAVERGLMARVAPLEQTLTGLRAELAAVVAEAKFAALEADLHSGIAEYTTLATRTMAALARSVARHQYLVAAGRAPELMNGSINATACGSFTGYPVQGNVADMMQAERQRIVAEFA